MAATARPGTMPGVMGMHLIAVGRARAGPERALFDHYAGRLASPLAVREVEEKRPLPTADLLRRERDLLLAAVPRGAVVVALDGRGKALDSVQLAQRLAQWRDRGAEVAFLIGGHEGLDDGVLAAADLVLSLGPMTWPHLLVRALLAEQLYRAQCILAGHPYHRD